MMPSVMHQLPLRMSHVVVTISRPKKLMTLSWKTTSVSARRCKLTDGEARSKKSCCAAASAIITQEITVSVRGFGAAKKRGVVSLPWN